MTQPAQPEAASAGTCSTCGGEVFHRPGSPGEYDHDHAQPEAEQPQPLEGAGELPDGIDSHPDKRGGELCLADSRIPASMLVQEVASGQSLKEIADDRELELERLTRMFRGIASWLHNWQRTPAACEQTPCEGCQQRFPLADLSPNSAHPESAFLCRMCLADEHIIHLTARAEEAESTLAAAQADNARLLKVYDCDQGTIRIAIERAEKAEAVNARLTAEVLDNCANILGRSPDEYAALREQFGGDTDKAMGLVTARVDELVGELERVRGERDHWKALVYKRIDATVDEVFEQKGAANAD